MKEITLVTSFFDIGRGQDQNKELARSNERYFQEFTYWARIKNPLIVYTSKVAAERVREIRKGFGLEEKTTIVVIEQLFEIEKELLEKMEKIAKSESFLNFRFFQDAFSNNPRYDYLWMLKYYFMNDAYEKGFLTENVAWIDFGFDHGGRCYPDCNDFDFLWEYDFKDKIHLFCLYHPDKTSAIESLQFLDDCVMATMVCMWRERIPELWRLVRKAIEALIMIECIDDDQQLLLMSYKARPEIFEVHVSDWGMQMKECGASHMKIRETNTGKAEESMVRKVKNLIRKVFPNKKEAKYIYAKRVYNMAKKFW